VSGLLRRHAYGTVTFALVGLFLTAFVVVERLQVPVLTDPRPGSTASGWLPAGIGVLLLVADVVLPVPSSGVMIVQGAAYGLALGALLSLLGGTGATMVGYLLGRRGRPALERWAGAEQQARAVALLDRHGVWAVVVTRPVPVLAEVVSVMAGTGRLPWWQVLGAGALGNVVPAVAYAAVGAYAASFVNAVIVFALVMGLAAAIGWRQRRTNLCGQYD
jgi:uncharacterized membrane protein YdjX (TVP38/TMEM64 family)